MSRRHRASQRFHQLNRICLINDIRLFRRQRQNASARVLVSLPRPARACSLCRMAAAGTSVTAASRIEGRPIIRPGSQLHAGAGDVLVDTDAFVGGDPNREPRAAAARPLARPSLRARARRRRVALHQRHGRPWLHEVSVEKSKVDAATVRIGHGTPPTTCSTTATS